LKVLLHIFAVFIGALIALMCIDFLDKRYPIQTFAPGLLSEGPETVSPVERFWYLLLAIFSVLSFMYFFWNQKRND
jgi:hypothetical protein